jgi:hypothetical protein
LAYFVFLKRDPDPDGLKHWKNVLNTDPNGEKALILGFINSTEYCGRADAR